MKDAQRAKVPASEVTAVFADCAFSFGLSSGATFADLAGRLARFRGFHSGSLTAVHLKFASAPLPVSGKQVATKIAHA